MSSTSPPPTVSLAAGLAQHETVTWQQRERCGQEQSNRAVGPGRERVGPQHPQADGVLP